MPVTTEPALALGSEFFAFPKFLADIRFTETAGERRCRLAHRGEHVLTLVAGPAPPARPRVWQAFAHTWMDGQPQRAEARMHQRDRASTLHPGAARITLGDDRCIAHELRRVLLTDRSCALEGQSVVDVANQAGHSPTMTLSTYAHVMAEVDGGERVTAESAIRAARGVQKVSGREDRRRAVGGDTAP